MSGARVKCALSVLAVLAMAGCAVRVPVDHDDDPATPEVQMDEAGVQRWAAARERRASAQDAAAKADAERTVRRAQRTAGASVEDAVDSAEEHLAGRLSESAGYVDRTRDIAEDAIARIRARETVMDTVVQAVASPQAGALAGLVPWGGTVLGIVGTALGYVSSARQRGRAARVDYAASRVVDSIDALKLKAPEVASAMKAHAAEVSAWQGPEGMALVARHQAGV